VSRLRHRRYGRTEEFDCAIGVALIEGNPGLNNRVSKHLDKHVVGTGTRDFVGQHLSFAVLAGKDVG
jgi:hypothetical protein